MLKKSKLIAGIALIAQALTFLVLFFTFFSRKKKSANAYLGVSLAAAISGAALIAWHLEDEKKDQMLLWGNEWDDSEDFFDEITDGEIDCVIEDSEDSETTATSSDDVITDEI